MSKPKKPLSEHSLEELYQKRKGINSVILTIGILMGLILVIAVIFKFVQDWEFSKLLPIVASTVAVAGALFSVNRSKVKIDQEIASRQE